MPYLLEVCVDSVESAISAQKGGAHRIEVCANMVIGGTTPGIALFQEVKKHIGLKTHVLIRPRFGDFLYNDYEFSCMQREVELFCREGADGVVIGCLKENGELNREQMKALIELAGGKSVTLHRAFDMCREPFAALMQAAELGVDTILTSGQQENCIEGISLLRELCLREDGRIKIMAGAGVNARAIELLTGECLGLSCFHMSGKTVLPSAMRYRREQVHMGLPGFSEYEYFKTDEKAISQAREVLELAFGSREETAID